MNQTYLFPISIEACEEGGFFGSCPILQGCHAEGETYTEALENLSEVIKIHIEVRRKYNDYLPVVSIKKQTPFCVNSALPIGV